MAMITNHCFRTYREPDWHVRFTPDSGRGKQFYHTSAFDPSWTSKFVTPSSAMMAESKIAR